MKKAGKRKVVVAVSGGFDPVHVGHIRMMQKARQLGDELVVILNNDAWLMSKKGHVFMPQAERVELLKSITGVDRVVLTRHTDALSKITDPVQFAKERSIARELEALRPDVFANGGDRDPEDAANPKSSLFHDTEVCRKLGIKQVWGVGRGGKVQSSSWLTQKVRDLKIPMHRPWGHMEVLTSTPTEWIKTITVLPGKRLSLQKHQFRDEVWVCIRGSVTAEVGSSKKTLKVGDSVHVKPKQLHRLSSKGGGTIVEVAYGKKVAEDDIVRVEDDYGRV